MKKVVGSALAAGGPFKGRLSGAAPLMRKHTLRREGGRVPDATCGKKALFHYTEARGTIFSPATRVSPSISLPVRARLSGRLLWGSPERERSGGRPFARRRCREVNEAGGKGWITPERRHV
ncbi:hypothetical protein AAFF_G00308660 [Aldrovandia affinis]|uniref:Uncharacterized protein n=1 Tax=Aldrovandia affinis TaxID=143900 RepID=A0AAD7SPL0_9TELE|nr:hypothetical protein AAFF_G00308660 [Aldrovandia affinis]